jgi:acyl-CoA reductase-like NAD-dependent aldehyde dehydrogenase
MATQQRLDGPTALGPSTTTGGAGFFARGPLPSGVGPALFDRLARGVVLADERRDAIGVHAPFTGELLGRIPRGTEADVEEAVRRARAAQPAWEALGVRRRTRVALRFHDLLLSRREQALDIIQLESGKARRHALEEVLDTGIVALHYATHAPRYLRPKRHRGALPVLTVARELHHPVGVVGVIAPWNFPLILSITDLIAALLAGNAAVLRPDVQSSFTALWAAELLDEAGLPPGVLSVVTGEGHELGPPLIDRVDFVMFTGSTRTGRVVARRASERLIGYSLELGGKNPMLVLEDADVEAAVEGAVRGCFVGAGQVCVSIERAYVHTSLYDEFARRLAEKAKALRMSPSLDYDAEMGTLTTRRQLDTVQAHVGDAVDNGATVLAGGRPRPDLGPLFFEPTVLEGVRPGMAAHDEETFGPVVALYRVESDDEAVERANASRYGLNASVWSRSARHALAVARRLRTGTVNVNEAYAATWGSTASPIGGMKESGLGRRHGAEGILKYTETQTVAVQRGLPIAPPPGLSGGQYASVMSGLVKLMRHVPGLR